MRAHAPAFLSSKPRSGERSNSLSRGASELNESAQLCGDGEVVRASSCASGHSLRCKHQQNPVARSFCGLGEFFFLNFTAALKLGIRDEDIQLASPSSRINCCVRARLSRLEEDVRLVHRGRPPNGSLGISPQMTLLSHLAYQLNYGHMGVAKAYNGWAAWLYVAISEVDGAAPFYTPSASPFHLKS